MKIAVTIALAISALCMGCTPKLNDEEVTKVVGENLPAQLKAVVSLGKVQTDIASGSDESTVKFKTQLKLSQALYKEIDFDSAAKTSNGDAGLFQQVEEAARGLNTQDREALAESIQKATMKPAFIAVVSPEAAVSDWYGSFKSKKVIDKWVSSDFATEVAPKFEGRPRSEFKDSAIDVANGTAWFAEAKTRQLEVLQKMDVAKKLADKDSEIQAAKAAAANEREAKEAVLNAVEKSARQLPVELKVRKAALGGTLVLIMSAAQPMTVRLECARALQRFSRDIQLVPGRPTSFGHLEGWGFLSGDSVRITNPGFDPKIVTIP